MKLFTLRKGTHKIQNPRKKKGKSLFRKINDWLHLWLGLISGIVVFVVSITGCLYAFEREIRNVTEPYQYVSPQDQPFLLPSQIEPLARKYKYHSDTATVSLYGVQFGDPGQAAVVAYNDPKQGFTMIYMNPYSGKILKEKVLSKDFFRIVLSGHYYLFLPPKIGQPLVAWSILVFVVLMITGLIMWWPKKWNKTNRDKSFKVRWKANFKRLNYDLHNVLGFYVLLIGLILALTGLVWGFEWFESSAYFVTSGGQRYEKYTVPASDTTLLASAKVGEPGARSPQDRIYLRLMKEYHGSKGVMDEGNIQITYPSTAKEPITVYYNPSGDTYYKRDIRFFDQYSLQELEGGGIYKRSYQESGFADKLSRMNYDIHVGAIAGLTGKIIAFFASLVCASLPVTGFYIWWGRRKKKHKKSIRLKIAGEAEGMES